MSKTVKSLALLLLLLLLPAAVAHADDPEVIVVELVPTPSPSMPPEALVSTPASTPEPTPEPAETEVMDLEYDAGEARCLARAFKSCLPKTATREIRIIFGEVAQNRVDDNSGAFKGSLRYVFLQQGEYEGYDPDAKRTPENMEIADYVMRTWAESKLGVRTHRLVPRDGVYCNVSSDGKHATVWNLNWEVVYEY